MKKEEIFKLSIKELYDHILEYFDIRELVSPGVYEKYIQRLGYSRYDILARADKRLLETMLWIRINYGDSITINDWMWGGRFDERGLRDTSTPMTQKRAARNDAWLSSHPLFSAFDYITKGQTAAEHRDWLEAHSDELPHPIRLENEMNGKQISWVHLDVCEIPGLPRVYRFDI